MLRALLGARGVRPDSSRALPDDVIHMTLVCVPRPDPLTGRPREQMVTQVVTRRGLESMLRSYLDRLVERQEGYRQGSGRYAASTDDLGFFNNRAPISISIAVEGSGWSASAKLAGYPATCSVAFGSSGFPLPTIHSGAISCATQTALGARE